MRPGILIAACTVLLGSVVLAKQPHIFDATRLEPATAASVASRHAIHALSSTHSGTFIAPDFTFGCTGEATCEAKGNAYYKRIGVLKPTGLPTPTRGTMQAWLATNQFSPNPTTPAVGELRAVYYNRADLGFGRDMHCKAHRNDIIKVSTGAAASAARIASPMPGLSTASIRTFAGGVVYACYVTNYGDTAHPFDANGNEQQAIQRAFQNNSPIATVAMEVYRPDSGAAGEVRFFVYDTGGTQTDGHVTPLGGALTGQPIPYAILDNDVSSDPNRHKANPGTCMNCHGGDAPFSAVQNSPTAAETVVTGANFLPFDAQLFGYDTTAGSPIGEAAQRETMRKLNAFVKSTAPPAPSIAALIDGWYQWCGGVATASCAIDDWGHPYTPPSWASATTISGSSHAVTNVQIVTFYQAGPRKYCRTCHLARAADYAVQDYIGGNTANPNHLRLKSKLNPLAASSNMPNAERTFNGYWSDTAAQNAYSALWP
jgi:hypothetical protein